jgi:hypothetical protein
MRKQNRKLLNYINSVTALILMISVFAFGNLPEPTVQPDQIGGIGYWANPGDCVHPEGSGANFALKMTGDLQGCLYTFVEFANCTPSGVYREKGTETFVGWYRGNGGLFRTTYQFEAKFQDCPNVVGEIKGRCQHPVISGSGRGVFDGVMGRLDFKDNIQAGNFPYRGHFVWSGAPTPGSPDFSLETLVKNEGC